MVRVPAGWFVMGLEGGPANETPAHRVWVDAFLIDRREVTQQQFRRLSLPDPSHFKGPARPVEQVTWPDAIEFCSARSVAEGLRPCYRPDPSTGRYTCDFEADGYRLPTEAEWEYACRAGSAAEAAPGGGSERQLALLAWYVGNAGGQTHPVGQKQSNAWGLFDMLGNVAEWCNDEYQADYAGVPKRDGWRLEAPAADARNPRHLGGAGLVVLRGGAWNSSPDCCRSTWRAGENPRFHDVCFARDSIGFRCVRKAPP